MSVESKCCVWNTSNTYIEVTSEFRIEWPKKVLVWNTEDNNDGVTINDGVDDYYERTRRVMHCNKCEGLSQTKRFMEQTSSSGGSSSNNSSPASPVNVTPSCLATDSLVLRHSTNKQHFYLPLPTFLVTSHT